MKFVKIKWDKDDELPCWWEYDDSTPINNARLKNFGFGHCSGYDLTGCEIVEASCLYDLDWAGTKLYSDIYPTGWLSPEGKFYGCDYEYHALQAEYVHKVFSTRQMEELGFIKITKKRSYDEELIVLNANNPTLEQVKWFKLNFIAINRDEIIDYLEWRLKVSQDNINQDF